MSSMIPLAIVSVIFCVGIASGENTGEKDFSPLTRYSWCSGDSSGSASSTCASLCQEKGCSSSGKYPRGTYNLDCRECYCEIQVNGKAAYGVYRHIKSSSRSGQCQMDNEVSSKTYSGWGAARCNYFPDSEKVESDCANYWNSKF